MVASSHETESLFRAAEWQRSALEELRSAQRSLAHLGEAIGHENPDSAEYWFSQVWKHQRECNKAIQEAMTHG